MCAVLPARKTPTGGCGGALKKKTLEGGCGNANLAGRAPQVRLETEMRAKILAPCLLVLSATALAQKLPAGPEPTHETDVPQPAFDCADTQQFQPVGDGIMMQAIEPGGMAQCPKGSPSSVRCMLIKLPSGQLMIMHLRTIPFPLNGSPLPVERSLVQKIRLLGNDIIMRCGWALTRSCPAEKYQPDGSCVP